jgi:hypothetical protein
MLFYEFLKEAMKSSSIYEADEDVDYEYWSSNHNAHATLSKSNSLHKKCMNLLHLPDKYHISFLDGGADTCVLGQGWEILSTKSDYSSDIKVDLVEQDIPKLSYFDPSDAHDTNVKGKYANLVFLLDTIVMKNDNDLNQINKDSFYRKATPDKIDYEKLSPYFAFRPHDVIQHTNNLIS